MASRGLWDDVDKFYHNVLQRPDGSRLLPLRLFSLVGLFPLFAVEVLEPETVEALHRNFRAAAAMGAGSSPRPCRAGFPLGCGRARGRAGFCRFLRGSRMKSLLRRMLDETAFLSPYGIRSVSRVHLEKPFTLDLDGQHFQMGYVCR